MKHVTVKSIGIINQQSNILERMLFFPLSFFRSKASCEKQNICHIAPPSQSLQQASEYTSFETMKISIKTKLKMKYLFF